MKKTFLAIIIILAIIVALIIRLFIGGNTEKVESQKNFSEVYIESENVKVEVLPTEDLTTVVELVGDDKNDYRLHAKMKGDTLLVEVKRKWFKFFNFGFFNGPITLKVYLPQKKYELIEAETDNGHIEVTKVNATNVQVDTDNGKIELYDLKTTNLHTKTDNGKIFMKDVEGEIIGKADNGRISLITESLDRNIDLKTDNGTIEIKTKEEPKNVQFDIEVDNGSVSVFGNAVYDTVIGNGDNLVRLKTDNGNIQIQ